MQQKNDKTKYLAQIVGQTIRELRQEKEKGSINKFANEYDMDVGNTSRIENGLTDIKLVTLWKIAEALEIPTSKIVKLIESKVSKNFKIIDE